MHVQTNCPACGSDAVKRFCADCGQPKRHPHDLTLKHQLHGFFHEVIHVDGRLWTTLGSLVRRPGQAALDYVNGRRLSYIPPFRLFLFSSIAIMFFLQASVYSLDSVLKSAAPFQKVLAWGAQKAGMGVESYVAACNARFQMLMRINLLYVDTTLSILMASLLWRRARLAIGAHAIFMFYALTVSTLGASLIVWLGTRFMPSHLQFLHGPLAFAWSAVYLWLSLRKFYGGSGLSRTLKLVALLTVTALSNLLAFLSALLLSLPILQYAASKGI